MNSLIILLILWAVSKIFFGKAKENLPGPTPQQEDLPTYQLPPELRDKWGPKDKKQQTLEEPATVILNEPPEIPPKYKTQRSSPESTEVPVQRAEPKAPVAISKPKNSQEEAKDCLQEHCQPHQGLTPAMLRNGIILSEILGPPVARRRRCRTYQ